MSAIAPQAKPAGRLRVRSGESRWSARAYQIISQVGSYGEMFDRTVGDGSEFKIARGLNALWTEGGILYAPPIR